MNAASPPLQLGLVRAVEPAGALVMGRYLSRLVI